MSTVTYTGSLTVVGCGHCYMDFAVPQSFLARRKQDGKTFYCPDGHKMSYGSESDNEKLRRQLRSYEARIVHAQDQRIAAERSAAAYKGQVTKIKKRVANGVCPCCHRTFSNLARHIEGQHPEWQEQLT